MSNLSSRSVKKVRYEECCNNHEVLTGDVLIDGCMGFLPTQSDAFTCDACGCHRSFHKRTVQVVESHGSSSNSRGLKVWYADCRKNRTMKSYPPVDGCQEFWPREDGSAAAGSRAALTCAACGCHRNFHRRKEEREDTGFPRRLPSPSRSRSRSRSGARSDSGAAYDSEGYYSD